MIVMLLRGVAAIALALGLAAEVSAQRTGSRIGRNAEVGNPEDANRVLHIMARCIAARRPDFVSSWLGLLPGSPEERSLVRSQATDLELCTESDEVVFAGEVALSFQPAALRRPVALAAVERSVSRAPSASPLPADADPWFMPLLAGLDANAPVDRRALALQDFGHCVVVNAWTEARALFATRPESDEEAAAVQRITPALGPCLTAGVTINITRRNLRVLLAEPFYHVMNAAPAAATARR